LTPFTPQTGKTLARSKKPTKKKSVATRTPPTTPEAKPGDPANPPEELPRDFMDDLMFNAANYLYVRRKLFITLAIGLLVIIVSAYGGYRFLEYRDTQRHEMLYRAESIINDPQLSDSERFQRAMPVLDECVGSFEGTRQFPLALLYRGSLYYEQQRYAEAEADLKQVLTVLDKSADLHILASIYLANILQDQKKMDEAVAVLHDAKGEKMTDVILMELAEAYINAGQNEDARQMLETLIKDYPDSGFSQRAQQLMHLL
jgi:predicted negative regulator of RcsB-dependent stress response